MLTVVKTLGSTPREVGTRMIVRHNGEFFGTIGGGQLEAMAIAESLQNIKEGNPKTVKFDLCHRTGQCCGGSVEILMEVLNGGPRLYVFGAGHVGQALARTLAGTSIDVHLIDEREAWIKSERLPEGVKTHQMPWQSFVAEAPWDGHKTMAVVMTPSHATDQDIVEDILGRPFAFLGMIGSQPKWARFQQNLIKKGVAPEKLEKVKCPVGLDIGGNAPQEIAISIAAQLLKIKD